MKNAFLVFAIIGALALPAFADAQVRAICSTSGFVKCNESYADERGEACVGTALCPGGFLCEPDFKGGSPLAWDGTYHCSTNQIQGDEDEKQVFFTPQVTLPGSQFIAGEPIVVSGATLGEWISALYFYLVSAAGILATVMMMWGGVKYVGSFGSPQKMSAASDQIVSAMVGLVLTLGAYMILLTINPALVKFNGLTVPRVPRHEQGDDESTAYSLRGTTARPWSGQNVSQYDQLISEAAATYGVNRNVMKAIMLIESSGVPDVVSGAGACGLMQLLPTTAGLTCEQLKDPKTNITAGAIYLRSLVLDTCPGASTKHPCPSGDFCREGDNTYIAAAYNGGRGANYCSVTCPTQTWWQCTQNEGYAETRAYVLKFIEVLNQIQTKGW